MFLTNKFVSCSFIVSFPDFVFQYLVSYVLFAFVNNRVTNINVNCLIQNVMCNPNPSPVCIEFYIFLLPEFFHKVLHDVRMILYA